MKRKVAIYARVSTEHEEQLSALGYQVQYYDEILKKHPEWELYDRYIDEGITGTSIRKRKNFLRMLEDANNGCFDLIITREVSRFARNTVDTLQETRKLKKIGVEVYFTEDNIWTFNDEDGELKLTIMATLAQNESKKTSQRVKAGQKISFLNGVFYGTGNILGYDKVGSEMIINEEQARTVRLIYDMFLNGQGSTEIKTYLEANGHLTATGLKKWSASSIVRILRNPFYSGTIVYRKSYIPDYLEQKAKKNKGEVEQIIVKGRHCPIVTKEEFEQVQKILESHSVVKNGKRGHGCAAPKSVWTRKLICECGSSFNKSTYYKNEDREVWSYYFQCYDQKNHGSLNYRIKKGLDTTDACSTPIIAEWKLKLTANVIFDIIWNNKTKIIKIANDIIDQTIQKNSINLIVNDEIEEYENRIVSNKNKLDRIVDMYVNELIDKESFMKKKADIEKNNNYLQEKIEKATEKKAIPKEDLEDKLSILKKNIINNLEYDRSDEISEDLIESYVEKIVVGKDRYKWKLNYLKDIYDLNTLKNISASEINNDSKDFYLTTIIITDDDVKNYRKRLRTCGLERAKKLKNNIIVDLYI